MGRAHFPSSYNAATLKVLVPLALSLLGLEPLCFRRDPDPGKSVFFILFVQLLGSLCSPDTLSHCGSPALLFVQEMGLFPFVNVGGPCASLDGITFEFSL